MSIPPFLEGSQLQSSTVKAPTFFSLPLHIRVPRYLRIEADLEPLENGQWRSLSSTPVFLWEGPQPVQGWNMVEIDMERSVTGAAAVITLETSRDILTVELPLRAGKITRRMLRVPRGVKRITLCPINARGTFQLKHFRLVWLTPCFAKDRLLQRLVTAHRHFRGLPKAQVNASLKREVASTGQAWREVALRHYDSTFVSLCSKHNYQQWIDMVESLEDAEKSSRRVTVAAPDHEATSFSLVLWLTSSFNRGAIAASMDSLLRQDDPHWQLLVTGTMPDTEALAWLTQQCDAESRVTLIAVELEANGIKNSLTALTQLATGQWIGLMTPGAVLAQDALSRFSDTISGSGDLHFLYCDEDCLDAEGHRHSPNFKPGWNPDLLLSTPYLGYLGLWPREQWQRNVASSSCCAVETISGNHLIHEWALNLVARTAQSQSAKVIRVPKVLLHVRDDSRLTQYEQQPGHHVHLERVQAFLSENEWPATAQSSERGEGGTSHVRVKWSLPETLPLVSLLLPTRDGVDILKPCVDAILAHTDYRHFELLILDNQSECPATLEYMREVAERDERVRVLHWDQPFNYSAINNFGARESRGEIIGLVNNDIEPVNGEWLTEMVSQACRPDIGCVGAKLYYPNGTIQHAGVILGLGSIAGHAHRFFHRDEDGFQGRLKSTQNLSAVTAACLLVRKSVFDEVCGLDEVHLTVAYNDVDFCLRVREAGYRNLWTPYAELYHHESFSRGADDTPKKRARWLAECDYMRTTWSEKLDNDPAYNPNLTLVHEDFSLR